MTDPVASGKVPSDSPAPSIATVDQRMARVSALVALTTIFAATAYWHEGGFALYAALFAIPYVVFGVARSSRKWQAWGWALAWLIIALVLVATVFTMVSVMRRAHRSEMVTLLVLVTLLLSQAAQLFFVRRAFSGTIAFARPLFRTVLYYVCLLLFVGATLPNWYVPPVVRRENQAVSSLREYSRAMEAYAKTSKDAAYPPQLNQVAAPLEAGKMATSTANSELVCKQLPCTKNGYRFEYRPLLSEKRVTSYTISARPLEFEETGNRSFLLTSDGKIHQTRENRDALPTDSDR